jgi:hypothetical protein
MDFIRQRHLTSAPGLVKELLGKLLTVPWRDEPG